MAQKKGLFVRGRSFKNLQWPQYLLGLKTTPWLLVVLWAKRGKCAESLCTSPTTQEKKRQVLDAATRCCAWTTTSNSCTLCFVREGYTAHLIENAEKKVDRKEAEIPGEEEHPPLGHSLGRTKV